MPLIPLDIPAGFYRNGTDLEQSGRWRDGSLVRWRDGSLRPIGGWEQRITSFSTDPIRGMHTWEDLGSTSWIAGGSASELIVSTASGLTYDITPATLTAGLVDAQVLTGFGNSFFGTGFFGQPRPNYGNYSEATTWSLDNWGEYLVACSPSDGRLLEWDLTTATGSELVTNGEFATDTDWTKGTNWTISGGVAEYQQLINTFDADDASAVDVSIDTITITAHGFSDGDEVKYVIPASPATALGGLTGSANYFVVNSTANTLQLAATSGGAAIDLTRNALTIDGDDAAVVDAANDKIIEANTFTDGDYVTYSNGGGVDIGGLTDGANYYVIAATPSEFQLSLTSGGAAIDLTADYNITFDGDDAAVVDVVNDKIIVANTFSDGDEVTYTNGGGVDIGGLTDGTNYFIINSSATEFQLAATSGGAAITLTANNSVTVDATDAAVVDVATDVITIANTFSDGDLVNYSNGGGTDIGGLVDGTEYYIINASATDFQVSATSGGAAIDLTALGTGTAHVFRQDIGSSHNLDQDIGSNHGFTVDHGAGHRLERQNYGNLDQTVSGLTTSPTDWAHDVIVTLIDPNDDADATTIPAPTVKVTGTTSATVLVDQVLSVGENRFRFKADDTEVKIEIIPSAVTEPNFDIDDISLKQYPTALPIDNAPTSNSGLIVTEERFLFALGADGNPRKVQWSDREDNATWSPLSTNEAGDIELQTSGQIMQGIRTRGQTLIITDVDAHTARYLGPPYVYGFERVGTSCGAVSRKSAADVDVGVFWMGQRGFFSFDGNSVSEIPCDVHDYVFGDINEAQISKVWSFANGQFGEVWWFYPSSNSVEIDRYVGFDYKEGHWIIGELSRTSGVPRGVFKYPLMASIGVNIYDHEVGFNVDSYNIFAETGPISIGAGDQVMRVTDLIPDELTQGDVDVTFKTRFHPNDTERTYGPYSPSNPTSVRFTGRQVRMRVDGVRPAAWRVGNMRIEAKAGGRR